MKLKLVNFLCHEDFEIDLGNNGISLLSGHSGSGKTSILKAIFFALFGEGNKLQMYGKTSCSVELNFDDIKILKDLFYKQTQKQTCMYILVCQIGKFTSAPSTKNVTV